jgi:hypothetical protein
MPIARTAAALLLTLTLAAPAVAQEAASEFGRASGGDLALALKSPSNWSGSLGISLPFFSSQEGKRRGAAFGGTLLPDRLWFFGTAEHDESPRFLGAAGGLQTNLNAQLGDRQSLGAALRNGRDLVVPQSAMPSAVTIPSSFLSLRYNGIVSSNMFFTATVARSSTPQAPASPVQP